MSTFGLVSGYISGGKGGSGPTTSGYAVLRKTVGVADGPVAGLFTYQNAALIGATGVEVIVVNNGNETEGVDFTFNSGTGTVTRNNAWYAGPPADSLVMSYIPAA